MTEALERHNELLQKRVAELEAFAHNLKQEFDNADRLATVRSWAVDRAIKLAEVNKAQWDSEQVCAVADKFVAYTKVDMPPVEEPASVEELQEAA